jgi:hypothetical protein
MSRVIVKVVVVVVVMIRAGSFGSADLFDCENLSDDRFWQASSLEKSVLKNCRWLVRSSETIRVEKRSWIS